MTVFNSHISIGELTERAAASGSHLLPIFEAARAGLIAVVGIEKPSVAFPARHLGQSKLPTLVIVHDDMFPERESVGPAGWRSAERLRRWPPCAVIVHGGAAHRDHYRAAVFSVLAHRHVVFVETDSAHADAWAHFLDCPATLVMHPPAGEVHPDVRVYREGLH